MSRSLKIWMQVTGRLLDLLHARDLKRGTRGEKGQDLKGFFNKDSQGPPILHEISSLCRRLVVLRPLILQRRNCARRSSLHGDCDRTQPGPRPGGDWTHQSCGICKLQPQEPTNFWFSTFVLTTGESCLDVVDGACADFLLQECSGLGHFHLSDRDLTLRSIDIVQNASRSRAALSDFAIWLAREENSMLELSVSAASFSMAAFVEATQAVRGSC